MNIEGLILGGVWLLLIVMILGVWRIRRKRGSVGPAAAGAMYELLDDKRRAALEIIEERTGERDPEDRDGNLPELENPTGPKGSPLSALRR